MNTPAAVYEPSEKEFPACVCAPDYPESMLVQSVRRRGHFRWKKHEVFLSEVLWGEMVGLLPIDDRWFIDYFAQYPIAHFDSQELKVKPLSMSRGLTKPSEEEGGSPPSSSPQPPVEEITNVSGMPSV